MHHRKATLSDAPTIFNLVNAAYGVETGYTGLAFKRAPRYPTLDETETDVVDFWVMEAGDVGQDRRHGLAGGLAGCVRVVVKDGVACIGPVAVWPQLQVGLI